MPYIFPPTSRSTELLSHVRTLAERALAAATSSPQTNEGDLGDAGDLQGMDLDLSDEQVITLIGQAFAEGNGYASATPEAHQR